MYLPYLVCPYSIISFFVWPRAKCEVLQINTILTQFWMNGQLMPSLSSLQLQIFSWNLESLSNSCSIAKLFIKATFSKILNKFILRKSKSPKLERNIITKMFNFKLLREPVGCRTKTFIVTWYTLFRPLFHFQFEQSETKFSIFPKVQNIPEALKFLVHAQSTSRKCTWTCLLEVQGAWNTTFNWAPFKSLSKFSLVHYCTPLGATNILKSLKIPIFSIWCSPIRW